MASAQATVCQMGTPLPPPQKGGGACPPIFGSCLLWPNGWVDEAGIWQSDFVLDEDPARPQFSAHFYCGQMTGCIKVPLGTDVGLIPGDFALDGDPVLLPKKGAEPPSSLSKKISAHVYCGQTAGWIKMPLGTKVGLSPGDSVLDGDPAPPYKGGGAPSIFSDHGMEVGLGPRPTSMPSAVLIHPAVWPQ